MFSLKNFFCLPWIFFFFCINFCFLAMSHGIQDLSSQPGIKPMLPAVEACSLSHLTIREVPFRVLYYCDVHYLAWKLFFSGLDGFPLLSTLPSFPHSPSCFLINKQTFQVLKFLRMEQDKTNVSPRIWEEAEKSLLLFSSNGGLNLKKSQEMCPEPDMFET